MEEPELKFPRVAKDGSDDDDEKPPHWGRLLIAILASIDLIIFGSGAIGALIWWLINLSRG